MSDELNAVASHDVQVDPKSPIEIIEISEDLSISLEEAKPVCEGGDV